MRKPILAALGLFCLLSLATRPARAQLIFSDDFNGIPDGQPAPNWTPLAGTWVADNGTYHSTTPSNNPPASSMMNTVPLADFTLDFDFINARDGGVLFHLLDGLNALALIVRPNFGDLYWHIGVNGNWGPSLNVVGLPTGGSLYAVHLTGAGNTYTADVTVNSQTYTTSLTTAAYGFGQFALYDFDAAQRFDNVRLYGPLGATDVPEPGALALGAGLSALGLAAVRRRKPAKK